MAIKTDSVATSSVAWQVPAGLILGSFIVLPDATIVSVALPTLGNSFHAGTSELQWVYNAYTLCLSALLLTSGSLGDKYGRKRAYLRGVSVFTIASAVCGAAPNVGTLIAFRAVQGGAGAAVATSALSMLAHTYQDPKQRAEMFGILGMIAGVAVVLGPVLGGALVESTGWRIIFLVNVPVGAVTVWLGAGALSERSDREKAPLDVVGQLLALLLLGSLTYGLIITETLGWTSPVTITALVVAAAATVAFVLVEQHVARPMLPMSLFTRPTFAVPNIASFVLGFGTSAVFFLLSLFLQQVLGLSPFTTGLRFLPLTVAIALVAPMAGRLAGRYGPYGVMVCGYTISGLALGGLMLLVASSGTAEIAAFCIALGIGMGVSISPTQLAGVIALPPQRAGLASACINTTRQSGTTMGVAVLGLIVANSAGDALSPTYGLGFVHGLHIAGLVAGVATLATAAMIAQFAGAHQFSTGNAR